MKRGKTNKLSFSAMADMHRAELQKAWQHQSRVLAMSAEDMKKMRDKEGAVFSSDESEEEEEDDDDMDMDAFAASLEGEMISNQEKKKKKKKKATGQDDSWRRFVEEEGDSSAAAIKEPQQSWMEPPDPPKQGGVRKKNRETGRMERVLIRKRIARLEDGIQTIKWEYITDAKQIQKELAKQKEGDSGGRGSKRERKDGEGSARKLKPGGSSRPSGSSRNRRPRNDGIVQDGSKMKISINRLEGARHKMIHGDKKRKRSDAVIEAEREYVAPSKSDRSRRLRKNPELVLGEHLKPVVEAMFRDSDSEIYFNAPVNTRALTDYVEKIGQENSTPVDLSMMKNKVQNGQYTSSKQLREDMDKLVRNSEIYNGPDSPVTQAARRVREVGLKVWAKRADEIEKIDQAISEKTLEE